MPAIFSTDGCETGSAAIQGADFVAYVDTQLKRHADRASVPAPSATQRARQRRHRIGAMLKMMKGRPKEEILLEERRRAQQAKMAKIADYERCADH